MNGMGGGWWMGAGSLLVIALIAVVVLVLTRRTNEPRGAATARDAQEILADRFASGDIDEVEYHARLQALRQ